MDRPWKYCAKLKKPVTKDHISYDTIYVKHSEKAYLWGGGRGAREKKERGVD